MRSPGFYYAAFFATGIATVSTGALVALHGTSVGLADGDIGRFIAAQFGGQLIGSYFVGRKVASRLVLGAGVTATAMVAQAVAGRLSLPLLFLMGFGLGLSMASINTLVGIESPAGLRARRLEILNVFWPLGAAFGPWLLNRIPERYAFQWLFSVLAFSFLAVAASVAVRRGPGANQPEEPAQPGAPFPIFMSIFALLAIGVESGLANWLPTFQGRYLSAVRFPLPLATIFWGSILVSRVFASQWLQGRSERLVFRVSTLAAGIGSVAILLLHTPWLLGLAVVGTAFVIGPVYPLLLTEAIKLPRRGLVFLCAAVGSALFPWLIGRSAMVSHSLRTALALPVAGCLLLFLLAAFRSFPSPAESTAFRN